MRTGQVDLHVGAAEDAVKDSLLLAKECRVNQRFANWEFRAQMRGSSEGRVSHGL